MKKDWKNQHCSGCTDPDPLGGTHSFGTIEHGPEPMKKETPQWEREFHKRFMDKCGCLREDIFPSELEDFIHSLRLSLLDEVEEKIGEAETTWNWVGKKKPIKEAFVSKPSLFAIIQQMKREEA